MNDCTHNEIKPLYRTIRSLQGDSTEELYAYYCKSCKKVIEEL